MARVKRAVTVKGAEKIDRNFKRMIRLMDDREVLDMLQEQGEKLQRDVRRRAPQGETGNLKEGVVAKKFLQQKRNQPATFVAFDYSVAPHAHLVEYGHGGPAPAPAHPFFRPALRAFRRQFLESIRNGLYHKIKKDVR